MLNYSPTRTKQKNVCYEIENMLYLAVGARVMLLQNIAYELNLVNSAIGILFFFDLHFFSFICFLAITPYNTTP